MPSQPSSRQAALERLKIQGRRRPENTESNPSSIMTPYATHTTASPFTASPTLVHITGRPNRQSLPTSQLDFSFVPHTAAPTLPAPGNLTQQKGYLDRAQSIEARVQNISNLLSSTKFIRALGSMPRSGSGGSGGGGAGGSNNPLASALAGLDKLNLDGGRKAASSPAGSVGSTSNQAGNGNGNLSNPTEVKSLIRLVHDLEGVVAGMKETAEQDRRAGKEYWLQREMGELEGMIHGLAECLGTIGQRVSQREGERVVSSRSAGAAGATSTGVGAGAGVEGSGWQGRSDVRGTPRRPLQETQESRQRAAVERLRKQKSARELEGEMRSQQQQASQSGSGFVGGFEQMALGDSRRGQAAAGSAGGRGGNRSRGGSAAARGRGDRLTQPAWNF